MRSSIILILLLFVVELFGQTKASEPRNEKYVLWVSPSSATHVYGVMLSFFPKLPEPGSNDYYPNNLPTIYGAEVNLSPLGLLMPFPLLVHSIDPETHLPLASSVDSIPFDKFKIIHGLQIGFANMEPTITNGLDISVTGSFESKSNGVTLSLVMNKHYISNGLTFAFVGNHDIECKGVQIGMLNSAVNLKGIQIGLWNKNQKRNLPLINWAFK